MRSISVIFVISLMLAAVGCGTKTASRNFKGIEGIIWSFDNRWAVVGFQDKLEDPEKPLVSHTWLTDAQLKPVRHLDDGVDAAPPLACFSRDGKYLFFQSCKTGKGYKILRLELNQKKEPEVVFESSGDPLLYLMAGVGDELITHKFSNVRNLFRIQGGKETPVLKRDLPSFISQLPADCAHHDCLRDGKATFRLHPHDGDEASTRSPHVQRIAIPLSGGDVSWDQIEKQTLEDDLLGQSVDGKIKVLSLTEGDDENKTILRIAWEKKHLDIPVKVDAAHFKLDRAKIVWMPEERDKLFMAGGDGQETVVMDSLPEKMQRIAGFNETLGIACLEGRNDLYVVDCAKGTLARRAKTEFR